jgi:2-polyprenyl-3-methyl-5-hydroxy-6-metoxy-1,4-benzoquinol methylase
MRIAAQPEGMMERVGTALGLVPTPMVHTWLAQKIARFIMAATRLGIFEALAGGRKSAAAVATEAGTDPSATERLLSVLVTAGYLTFKAGCFALTPMARKWMLKGSALSLHDDMLFQYLEWKMIEGTEEYVRTGRPLDFHGHLTPEEWGVYQRGMRALAGTNAAEVVKRVPVPGGATALLDIGGSHGYYSVAICRKHSRLRATVLDLPQAVEQARPILEAEKMGDRVQHRAGDVLQTDLGEAQYDAVLISSLVHHFDDGTNAKLMKRIARALRPGGSVSIIDYIRLESPNQGGQVAWVMNLYFALMSQSGSWSFDDMIRWQTVAGLRPHASFRFRTIPGSGIQAATKPG